MKCVKTFIYLFLAFFIIRDFEFLRFASLLFVLALVSAGAVPFIAGFIFQRMLPGKRIPDWVRWALSILIVLAIWHFSSAWTSMTKNNPVIGTLYLALSVFVFSGFMETGMNFSSRSGKTRHS